MLEDDPDLLAAQRRAAGSLDIESTEGEGTVVAIRLPLGTGAGADPAADKASQ